MRVETVIALAMNGNLSELCAHLPPKLEEQSRTLIAFFARLHFMTVFAAATSTRTRLLTWDFGWGRRMKQILYQASILTEVRLFGKVLTIQLYPATETNSNLYQLLAIGRIATNATIYILLSNILTVVEMARSSECFYSRLCACNRMINFNFTPIWCRVWARVGRQGNWVTFANWLGLFWPAIPCLVSRPRVQMQKKMEEIGIRWKSSDCYLFSGLFGNSKHVRVNSRRIQWKHLRRADTAFTSLTTEYPKIACIACDRALNAQCLQLMPFTFIFWSETGEICVWFIWAGVEILF